MGSFKFLIIHCTATPMGRKVTGDDIRAWHLIGRKWKQVGYTDMFHEDGRVENLVKHNEDNKIDPWEITNGVKGLNGVSRHIVYVGGLDPEGEHSADTRTEACMEAMEKYVKAVLKKHPDVLVAGHNQFDKKDCPCFDVPVWLESIGVEEKNIYLPQGYKHKLFPRFETTSEALTVELVDETEDDDDSENTPGETTDPITTVQEANTPCRR
jgi:hypothetical protein